MNTATAALQAHVTAATIRTWCRRGVITAIKQAGRWIIDTASLAHRISIGQRKVRMTDQPKYRIEEGTTVLYGAERASWTIVRADGTPGGYGPGKDNRLYQPTYFTREAAEFYAKFYENTPHGYRLEQTSSGRNSIVRSALWLVTGSTADDPGSLRMTLETTWTAEGKNWPADTTPVDVLIKWANDHAAGAAKRITEKAEKDAIEAAEAAVREAREAQLAEARARKGTLATPRQVEFILQLLAARERSGEGGGMVVGYPTTRPGLEELSKGEASLYIDSLKSNY